MSDDDQKLIEELQSNAEALEAWAKQVDDAHFYSGNTAIPPNPIDSSFAETLERAASRIETLINDTQQIENTGYKKLKNLGVVGRKPTINKHRAVHEDTLRRVISRLDATDAEAADVLIWVLWHRAIDEERFNFLLADQQER